MKGKSVFNVNALGLAAVIPCLGSANVVPSLNSQYPLVTSHVGCGQSIRNAPPVTSHAALLPNNKSWNGSTGQGHDRHLALNGSVQALHEKDGQ